MSRTCGASTSFPTCLVKLLWACSFYPSHASEIAACLANFIDYADCTDYTVLYAVQTTPFFVLQRKRAMQIRGL